MRFIIKFFFVLSTAVLPAIVFAAPNIVPSVASDCSSGTNCALFTGDNHRVNFSPTGGGVEVSATGLSGYAWGETAGWIKFQSQNPGEWGVTNTCNNNGSMTLGGNAWGQNAGWISFESQNPGDWGVTISATGEFDGYAWSQNFGWLKFSCPGGNTCVKTSFTCPTGGNNGGGGGNSIGSIVHNPNINNENPPQLPAEENPAVDIQPPVNPTDGESPNSPIDEQPSTPPLEEFPGNSDSNNQGGESETIHFPQTPKNVIIKNNSYQKWFQILGGFFEKIKENITLESVGVTVASLGLLGGILNLPFRISNILFAIPSFMRRRKSWGTVYDSQTYEPLDPAYVQLFDAQGNEVASMITDLDGRYGFLVEPGTYTLRAGKTNYSFPSARKAGQTSDRFYQNLYFGEPIVITEKGEVIVRDIPMDSTGNDWNQVEKRRMNVTRFFKRNDMFIHRVIDVLLFAGFIYSVYALLTSQTIFNIVMVVIYVMTVAISLVGVPSRAFGSVKDKNGNPIDGSVIKLFNPSLNKEMAKRVIGKNGYYYLLTQAGEYYATVENAQSVENTDILKKTEIFNSRDGVIKKHITI